MVDLVALEERVAHLESVLDAAGKRQLAITARIDRARRRRPPLTLPH